MTKISETINEIIITSFGGILAFWAAIFFFIIKILKWIGAKVAEGAIADFIRKTEPAFEKKLEEKFSKIDKKIDKIEKDLHLVKNSETSKDAVLLELLSYIKKNEK